MIVKLLLCSQIVLKRLAFFKKGVASANLSFIGYRLFLIELVITTVNKGQYVSSKLIPGIEELIADISYSKVL